MTTYGAPERIWPYATGAGITVAVVGTGVDAAHPQLLGKVATGYDVVRNVAEGNVDCAGQSTAVAGLIAAERINGYGFYGIAPDTTILPVRVTTSPQIIPPDSDKPLTADVLAAGIEVAASADPDVIVVPDIVFVDSGALVSAVVSALNSGIVIIAPVGDAHPTQPPDADMPSPEWLTPYPAAYDGVIGVGSVGQNGLRAQTSQVGPYVDLVAPGEGVISTGIGGHDVFKGTPFAAGYVAAAAALLLSEPEFSSAVSLAQRPAAVEQRLTGTASPVSGYFGALGYGAGLVDPYRALTEPMTGLAPASQAPYSEPAIDPDVAAREASSERAASNSSALGWISLAALAGALCVIWFVRRSRHHGFRPVIASPTDDVERDREVEFIPGEKLFGAPEEPK
ncbi:S8 family serine peptidase [Epidermidibacterium keratini]